MKIYLNSKPRDIYELAYRMLGKKEETYYDDECTVVQCYQGRSRSRIDFRACVKTYFPDKKPKEITAFIEKMIRKNFTHRFVCPDIRRATIPLWVDEKRLRQEIDETVS